LPIDLDLDDSNLFAEHSLDDIPSSQSIQQQLPLLGASSDISIPSMSVWTDANAATFQYPTEYGSSGPLHMTLPSISNAIYASNMFSDLNPIPAENLLNMSSNKSTTTTIHNTPSTDYQQYLQMKVQNMKIHSNSPTTESTISDGSDVRSSKKTTQDRQQNVQDSQSAANNRASKSLTEISRRFVTIYGRDNTLDYIAGLVDPNQYSGIHFYLKFSGNMFERFILCILESSTTFNRVDAAAESLNVHVRRIYELIKILEILSLVAVSRYFVDNKQVFIFMYYLVCWR